MNDIKRIAVFTSRIDFFEYRLPADPAYLGEDNDPLWKQHVFCQDGTRRVLRQHASGDCIFLTGSGCQLSLEMRPLVCRLYPLTYTHKGIEAEPDGRCSIRMLCRQENVLEVFGITMELAERWHMDLYREMIQPQGGDTDEDWPDLRPAV